MKNMNKKPLKVAMVGCGGYAGLLIQSLSELPDDYQLVAVTARESDRDAAQACREKGIAVYGSVGELLDNLTPETCVAIIVSTSIDSHYAYTKQIVERGFHVLLEKPPVATIQGLDRLIELQRASGKFISVNFQHLFNPMTQHLKKRIAGREFGAIKSIKASALWIRAEPYFSRSHWSGCLQLGRRWVLDGTIGNPLAHLLAEALYLATPNAGMATPLRVQAELYHANEIESEDTSCLRIRTAEGVPVFYCASLCSDEMTPILCEIETEQAIIRLFDYFRVEITWADGRTERDETPGNDLHLDRRLMLEAIADKLVLGERPLITVEECRPYMLAWNGAFESFGAPVGIGEDFISMGESEFGAVRCIRDMPALIGQACRQQRLFSELGVEWARRGAPIAMANYKRFPSINEELKGRARPVEVGACDPLCPVEAERGFPAGKVE